MRGDRLRLIREARGFTQVDLAQRIGIHAQQLYKIENNISTNPSADTLVALARVLDVSTDYLLGLVDEQLSVLQEEDLSLTEHKLLQAARSGRIVEALKALTTMYEGDDLN
jgi:transcriptional regulator with XRE-family HTH domain